MNCLQSPRPWTISSKCQGSPTTFRTLNEWISIEVQKPGLCLAASLKQGKALIYYYWSQTIWKTGWTGQTGKTSISQYWNVISIADKRHVGARSFILSSLGKLQWLFWIIIWQLPDRLLHQLPINLACLWVQHKRMPAKTTVNAIEVSGWSPVSFTTVGPLCLAAILDAASGALFVCVCVSEWTTALI